MADNVSYVEFVRFQAQGLDEIEARTKAYAQQVSELERKNRLLAGALKDPSYARHAADVNRLTREYERLKHAANVQALVAEHGKFGAAMRLTADHFGKIKSAALIGLGAVSAFGIGLMRSGLQGTVEGYRLELAWTRLGRQAAGIALPAIEKLTNWVAKATNWFSKLSGSQQDTILSLGLVAAGAVTLSGALSGVASMVSLAVSGGKALYAAYTAVAGAYTASAAAATAYAAAEAAATRVRVVGVTTAAASGGMNAAAALGAGGLLALPAASGGMNAAAALGAGGLLALPAAGGLTKPPPRVVNPGGGPIPLPGPVVGGTPAAQAGKGGLGFLAGRGAGLLRFGGALAGGVEAYSDARRYGDTGFTGRNVLNTALRSGDVIPGFRFLREQLDKEMGKAGFAGGRAGEAAPGGGSHRDVTPLGMGFGELGGTWFKLQEEFLKQSQVKAEEEKSRQDLVDQLKQLNDNLQKQLGVVASGDNPFDMARKFLDKP